MRTVRSVRGYGYFMAFLPFVIIVLKAAGRRAAQQRPGTRAAPSTCGRRGLGAGPIARETGRNPPLFSVFLNS